MPESAHQGDHPPVHPEVRHEPRDVSFRAILVVLILALLGGVLLQLAVWGFFTETRSKEDAAKRSPYPLAPGPSTALPEGPRLEQINRLSEVESGNVYLRQQTFEKELHRYGETAEKGFVRVPIERAMDHLAGKLPAGPEPSAAQQRRAGGLVTAGESNSGRMFNKGDR
jgi:hypothetical protein